MWLAWERVEKRNIETCYDSLTWALLDLTEVLAVHIGNQMKGINCFFHFLFRISCSWSELIQDVLPVTLTEGYSLLGELFTIVSKQFLGSLH